MAWSTVADEDGDDDDDDDDDDECFKHIGSRSETASTVWQESELRSSFII